MTSSVSWNFSWEWNRPFGWKAKCLQVTKHKVQSTVTQHLQTTRIWLTENLHRQFGSKWSGSWTDCQRITNSRHAPRVLFFSISGPFSFFFLYLFAVWCSEKSASTFVVTYWVLKIPRTRLISTTKRNSGPLFLISDLLLTSATCWLKSFRPCKSGAQVDRSRDGLISPLFSLQSLIQRRTGRDHINSLYKVQSDRHFLKRHLDLPFWHWGGNECLVIPPSPRCWCNLIASKHVSHNFWKGASVEHVADFLTIFFYPGEREGCAD